MSINMIVAAGRNGEIGLNGDLIWNLPGDLKRFKEITTGHPVIMGRKTWESLPKRPLPGRRNIILTRNRDFRVDGAEIAQSIEDAIHMTRGESIFIIGGAEIYKLFLPFTDYLYLTEVDDTCANADAHLPVDMSQWEVMEQSDWKEFENTPRFRYVTLKSRNNK